MAIPAPKTDRTALVTGASAGIGEEFAKQLAARGHGVTLVARREDRLTALAQQLHADHGIRAEVIAADLADADARTGMLAEIADRGLIVDVLVNNAGFSTLGPVAASDPEGEMKMVRVDVEAVSHLCSALLPGMVERGEGAVCNVASVAAFQPTPGQAGYGAAKAFVKSYTEAVAVELRGTGVTISALCPGPVDTEFADAAGFEGDFTDTLPKPLWVSAADVAKAAIDGLDKGQTVVIPGIANRIMANIAGTLPSGLVATIVGSQHPALKN